MRVMAGMMVAAMVLALCGGVGLAEPRAGEEWIDPGTGMVFVWVDGGTFMMGQSEEEEDRLRDLLGDGDYEDEFLNELPRHEVALSGFWMGKYEVTNDQFRLFRPDHDSGDYQGVDLNEGGFPVARVSWEDAMAYVRWMNGQGVAGFSLPTEAQWEYGARAGAEGIYPWGDDPEEACAHANVADQAALSRWPDWMVIQCDDGHAAVTPVGTFPANAFGLHDMLGNVWEWCLDAFQEDAYRLHAAQDPVVQGDDESRRIARGASWGDFDIALRPAYRRFYNPSNAEEVVGFRLVRME